MVAPSLFGFNDRIVSFLSEITPLPDRKDTMVREEWMSQLVRECQIVSGVFVTADVQRLRSGIDAFIDALPDPATPLESHVMRLTLLDVAVRGGGTAHHRYHAAFPCRCRFSASDLLDRHWRAAAGDPRAIFSRWADDYVTSLDRTHIVPLGARAVRALEAHSLTRLDVKRLASALRCSPTKLRHEFRAWTGMAPQRYHSALRAKAAVDRLRQSDLKIDVLAGDLGYRSKTNMYRALRTTCGLTPRQVRRLTTDEVALLLAKLPVRN